MCFSYTYITNFQKVRLTILTTLTCLVIKKEHNLSNRSIIKPIKKYELTTHQHYNFIFH